MSIKIKYLSLAQAQAIRNDYQHLAGTNIQLPDGAAGLVKLVVVAPYSRILQWQFMRMLHDGIPYEEALKITPNERYDVVLVAERGDGAWSTADLREYLKEHSIDFDLTRYSHLRTA